MVCWIKALVRASDSWGECDLAVGQNFINGDGKADFHLRD